jgi:uncharacterized membrane protein required for colicin V production
MSEFIDHLLGFLPPGGVFLGGAGIILLILVMHYLINALLEVLKLPWMQEENQKKRNQLTQKNNKSQK